MENHIHGIEGGLFIALGSALVTALRQTVYLNLHARAVACPILIVFHGLQS